MSISRNEFARRIEVIRNEMSQRDLDALLVYGDEYRRENLRYVSNFWPIFERGACVIPRHSDPILVGAPEGEDYAREMCVWNDIRNIREFACVSVPEAIDYPLASFTTLADVLHEALDGGSRLGLAGRMDMPGPIFERLQQALGGQRPVDADDILQELRLIKSPAEVACLREAGRQACTGYSELMKTAVPGNTERQAAGAAEGAARMAGAEQVVFTVFGSGKRADTIIGRATEKVIESGDMIMAAFAVQYEGYVVTAEYPFVAGSPSDAQRAFLNALFEAANVQLTYLKPGVIAGEMVQAVHKVFKQHGLEKYDVYPPMHGIGLAEAESPYPDEEADYPFRTGMCVNSDISLFGHPAGSNRIEESFVITEDGVESMTPLIRQLCATGV